MEKQAKYFFNAANCSNMINKCLNIFFFSDRVGVA